MIGVFFTYPTFLILIAMHTFKTLCILDVLFYIAYSARYSFFVLMCRKTHITHSLTHFLKKKNKKQQRLTERLSKIFLTFLRNRRTHQLDLLTLRNGERRNLIQIGSLKDRMIRLGSIIGFHLWKT